LKKILLISNIVIIFSIAGLSGCNETINLNPDVLIIASENEGINPLTVNFSFIASNYSGNIVSCWWNIENKLINKMNISHTFIKEGRYIVKLTIEDEYGNKGADIIEIFVN
jgi:PKD repeat protein